MHPEEIKAAMRMRGVTGAALARELNVAGSSVSQVINGRVVSARIRWRISEITGLALDRLWPPKKAASDWVRSE
ncbi:MAG: helix-turn-helix domain-containing protein [Burkholderiaceae bacterium]|jgi:lambda repressor-like predicted transcriptional regulator|nr:helix-turn-helix domain-containing protein [Burkholderiaceae bacterium]